MLIATTATVGLLLVGVLALSMTPDRLGSPEESLATANDAAQSQASEPVGGAFGGAPMSVADSLLRAVSTLLSSTSLPASADTQSDLLEPTVVVTTVPALVTNQSTTTPSSVAEHPAVPTEPTQPSESTEDTTASTAATDATAPPESTTPEAADAIGDDVDTGTDDTAAPGAPEASGLATLTPPPAPSSSIPGQSTTSSSSSSTSTTTSSSSTTTLPASTTTIGIPAKQMNNG